MRLLLPLIIYIFFTHLGALRAIVFFHFPRSFQHPVFQSLSSDQTNDDDNQIPPFPSIFSVFRHRSIIPFQNLWRDNIRTSTPRSAEKDDSKVNTTLPSKIENITDHMSTKESFNLPSKHHIFKKSMENSSKSMSVAMYFHPWSRLLSLRKADFKPLERNWRSKESMQSFLRTNQNGTQQEDNLREKNFNSTTDITRKNPKLISGENCTRKNFISRYLFIWTINWASLAVHLTAVLLICSFLTIAIVLCRPCCSRDQSKSQVYNISPLKV